MVPFQCECPFLHSAIAVTLLLCGRGVHPHLRIQRSEARLQQRVKGFHSSLRANRTVSIFIKVFPQIFRTKITKSSTCAVASRAREPRGRVRLVHVLVVGLRPIAPSRRSNLRAMHRIPRDHRIARPISLPRMLPRATPPRATSPLSPSLPLSLRLIWF